MKTAILYLALVLPAVAQTTIAVGNCRPYVASYATISAAIAAAVPNSTVLICPGSYPEQVTVTQPLTLRGLNLDIPGNDPVIVAPSGGLLVPNSTGDLAQLFVQASGPVDVSNIIVDGTGVQFTCPSQGGSPENGLGVLAEDLVIGIEYLYTSGSLIHVTAQNQSPGGCGVGIAIVGSPDDVNTVNIQQSSILKFDDVGIAALYDDFFIGFVANLGTNTIISSNTGAFAGVYSEGPEGQFRHNVVNVAGQYGLYLENFYGGLAARENTVVGAGVGIRSGADESSATDIVENNIIESGVGIQVIAPGTGATIESNIVTLSTNTAIDTNCSELAIARNNVIFGAPVGVANIASGNVGRNTFLDVTTATTECF